MEGHESFQFGSRCIKVTPNTIASVPVIRINGTDGWMTVRYRTTNGTALSGTHYHEGEGELIFGPGQYLNCIEICILPDFDSQEDKFFGVELFDPTGRTIISQEGRTTYVIIRDTTKRYSTTNDRQGRILPAPENQTKKGGVLKSVLKTAAIGVGTGALALGGGALIIGAAGFGAGGVAAGSLAAAYQATLGGTIASGSTFAVLQSIGAAGFAASTKAAVVTGCTAATAAIRGFFSKNDKK